MFKNLQITPSLFIIFFTAVSILTAQLKFFQDFTISSLTIAIFLGIILGNTIRQKLPENWNPTIIFFTKQLLRLGIIFYGFRVSFQDIADVGLFGAFLAIFAVLSTFFLGNFIGKKLFKLDGEVATLVSAGSAVCGAAAILATESTIKAKAGKSSLAIATIVIFGTISMFLYPFLFKVGFLSLPADQIGIFLGASIHDVAQVVASGNMFTAATADSALIVKMTRVIFLVPFLVMLGLFFAKNIVQDKTEDSIFTKARKALPMFALYFLIVIAINSILKIPKESIFIQTAHSIAQALLTAAMFSLGLETNLARFKKAGGKAFGLAFVLFLWLGVSTYLILKIW